MANKKPTKKVTVRTVTSLKKKSNEVTRKTPKNKTESKKKANNASSIKKTSTGSRRNEAAHKSDSKTNSIKKSRNTVNRKRTIIPDIEFNKAELKKIRSTVRKADGTFFKKEYYDKLLKKVNGKTRDEVDDILIELRNKNKNVRYFVESKADTLHFQTGNFVDRLAGKVQTVSVRKNAKRKGETKVTGELKKGTTITVIDLKGDEHTFKSIGAANEMLSKNNAVINKVIDRLRGDAIKSTKDSKTKAALKKRKKGLGTYFVIPETVKSNSEREVVSVKYDFRNITIQGSETVKAQMLLNDELEETDF